MSSPPFNGKSICKATTSDQLSPHLSTLKAASPYRQSSLGGITKSYENHATQELVALDEYATIYVYAIDPFAHFRMEEPFLKQ